MRTLELIDTVCGFDNYILSTPEIDLQSKLGMTLKREMLLALANKSMYPDNPMKRDAILKKYDKFIIPAEEAEWVGLSLHEAERKQHEVEEAERLRNLRPLKEVFAEELAQKLVSKQLDEPDGAKASSWLSKLNPFQDK
jgi:large subunit ribosomal protein L28